MGQKIKQRNVVPPPTPSESLSYSSQAAQPKQAQAEMHPASIDFTSLRLKYRNRKKKTNFLIRSCYRKDEPSYPELSE